MKLCQASHGMAVLGVLAILPVFSSGTSSSNVTRPERGGSGLYVMRLRGMG